MTEHAGRGDPRRSLELLWGVAEPPARGPKQGLSVDGIAAAAIALADAEGLDAVSMRRVADRLGKSAMALYTYVPSKAELLDLMLDRVQAEAATTYPLDAGWRPAVEAWARDGWAFYERHPWVLQVGGARSSLGPNEHAAYEAGLRLFDDLGLRGVDMARLVSVVSSFVRGSAKAVSDARTAEQATGVSDDDWWNARAPLLEEIVDEVRSARFPTIMRLAAEHAFEQPDRSPDDDTPYLERDVLDTFELGLQLLLDGVEVFISARSTAR
jgi:AcrR family transcriptional regulator